MCIKVSQDKIKYTQIPVNGLAYTEKMNSSYSRWVRPYDKFIKVFPLWNKWIGNVLPHLKGTDLLEVSFGTGFLLTQYPEEIRISGLDYNSDMVAWAKNKMQGIGRKATLVQGNVENMPYQDNSFNTVVNTMAFSGYPDGGKALGEMLRVLRPGGRLLLIDYDYPANRNIMGYWMVRFIEKCGDIMKDINSLIQETGCSYERLEIGAFGSVQFFIITKNQ